MIFNANLDRPNFKNQWNYIGFISIFSFSTFSRADQFFFQFGCQLASIFLPKIYQNRSKNRFWKASFLNRFGHEFLNRFWLDFGTYLAPMLATFRPQNGPPNRCSPLWLHFGSMLSLLAPFLTFLVSRSPILVPFRKVWGSISQVFRYHFDIKFYHSLKGSAEWAKPF